MLETSTILTHPEVRELGRALNISIALARWQSEYGLLCGKNDTFRISTDKQLAS
ncbi:hypothetical protein [Phormidium sp. CCY1219]|uniref:hypothetical protein n=1 Tax=Phormidium sp. CCY1219 TaxID=2886104 RepID=UPI002D76C0D1|nr:hypothetical protein [Phormidium sp. CCY1219]